MISVVADALAELQSGLPGAKVYDMVQHDPGKLWLIAAALHRLSRQLPACVAAC